VIEQATQVRAFAGNLKHPATHSDNERVRRTRTTHSAPEVSRRDLMSSSRRTCALIAVLIAGAIALPRIAAATPSTDSRGAAPLAGAHSADHPKTTGRRPHRSLAGRVGMNTRFYMDPQLADMVKQARTLKAGGMSIIRDAFKWDQVQPRPGEWKWQQTDAIMTAAATARLRVLAIVAYSAPWASSDPSGLKRTMYQPRRDTAYARFARAIAARYGAHGAFWAKHPRLPYEPLYAMELWNEPSGHLYWSPNPQPAAYARLARSAAQAIRAVDPAIKIVVCGDLLEARANYWQSRAWLASLLSHAPHLNRWADALSVHAYPSPMNESPRDDHGDQASGFDRISLIEHKELARGVHLPLWITEIGWSTSGGAAVSDHTQARYLSDAVVRGLRLYGTTVRYVFAFSWDKAGTGADSGYGLRNSHGGHKPAWSRLVHVIRRDSATAPTR
jgi:Cellulase (glycosyl hydrolase family 5)